MFPNVGIAQASEQIYSMFESLLKYLVTWHKKSGAWRTRHRTDYTTKYAALLGGMHKKTQKLS